MPLFPPFEKEGEGGIWHGISLQKYAKPNKDKSAFYKRGSYSTEVTRKVIQIDMHAIASALGSTPRNIREKKLIQPVPGFSVFKLAAIIEMGVVFHHNHMIHAI